MATTVSIYADPAYSYSYVNTKWLDARNSADASTVSIVSPSSVGIVSGYAFFRTYLSFDLSTEIIPAGSVIDSITISLKRSDRIGGGYIPTIAYAGNSRLTASRGEYSLYLDNIIGISDLATIAIIDSMDYYTSRAFDLATYSMITPGSILTVGIIDTLDFDVSDNSVSNNYLIDTDPLGLYPPYIEVTYSSAGYPNSIIGISSANIAGFSGVSSANISNIMGV